MVVDYPESFAELIDAVQGLGFRQAWDRPGPMASRDVVFRGEVQTPNGSVFTHLNLNCDRNCWVAVVMFDGMREWRTADEWEALLDRVPMREMTLAESAAFFRERIVEMAHAYLLDPGVEHQIDRIAGSVPPVPEIGDYRPGAWTSELTPELAELVGFLEESGFEVVEDETGRWTEQHEVLRGEVHTDHGTMKAEVSIDRHGAGRWKLSVGFPEVVGRIDAGGWLEVLDGVHREHRTAEQESLAFQARYVRDRLSDMAVRFQTRSWSG